ncbi:MAG: glycosyltransferase family 1 protein [Parcubacteria group bacterium]
MDCVAPRIAIDARMVRITGIGRYTEELVCAEVRLGTRPTVFLTPNDAAWWHRRYPNVPFRISSEPIYSWSEQLVLPARLARERFDLVHFANFNVPLTYRGPFVVTIHDTIPLKFAGERRTSALARQTYLKLLQATLERAQRVIVPSLQVRDELAEISDISRVVVIPHGISDGYFDPATTPAEAAQVFARYRITAPYALYVGNFRAHKNVLTLVKAFAKMRESIPFAELVLTGPITSKQLQALRSSLPGSVAQQVRLTGPVAEADLRVLYDAARLFILPSLAEGFGLPALEAAARGTAVIAAATTPVREFLHDAVLTFDPQNVEQLADAMVILWTNQELRRRQALKARSLALRRGWADVARETLEAYGRALVRREA